MSEQQSRGKMLKSNAYEMFILVLTGLSLVIMVTLWLPLPSATEKLLTTYDNCICFVFLADFSYRLWAAPSKRQFFFGERGWLDLMGSIPTLGTFKYSGLFRLARLSRVARITRLLRAQNKRELIDDVLEHRSHYAGFITILAAMLVLVFASILVLSFESQSPEANIKTGDQALWWSVVTITTVGYGDYYPITNGGRLTAFIVMFAGVGIIGSLASILASVLVSPSTSSSTTQDAAGADASSGVERELAAIRAELAGLRSSLGGASPPASPAVDDGSGS